MNDHLDLWQYCWFVIVILTCLLAFEKCGPSTEADDRARAGGGQSKVVETWSWD